MIYSKHETLEDKLVDILMRSPSSMKSLHERLKAYVPGLSQRAVYKAAVKLIEAGVLLKAGKIVRVDQEWVRSVKEKLSSTFSPQLSVGEKAVFAFKSMEHLDTFWKTLVFQLEELERDGQVFFYNPHNFWAYMPERKESEDAYYRHFAESKLHAFFTVGGDTQGDMDFKKTYQNEFLQIDARAISSLGRLNHLTILGDFIIDVRLPRALSASVDRIYETGRPITELSTQLNQMYRTPSNIRLVLENNPLKAKKLKRLFARNFYFRQEN